MAVGRGTRQPFTEDDDYLLVRYLARYNPSKSGRSGNHVYKQLADEVSDRWEGSDRHTWHSWRNRYVHDMDYFDHRVLKYLKKHGMQIIPSRASETKTISRNSAKKSRRHLMSDDDDGDDSVDEGDNVRKRKRTGNQRDDSDVEVVTERGPKKRRVDINAMDDRKLERRNMKGKTVASTNNANGGAEAGPSRLPKTSAGVTKSANTKSASSSDRDTIEKAVQTSPSIQSRRSSTRPSPRTRVPNGHPPSPVRRERSPELQIVNTSPPVRSNPSPERTPLPGPRSPSGPNLSPAQRPSSLSPDIDRSPLFTQAPSPTLAPQVDDVGMHLDAQPPDEPAAISDEENDVQLLLTEPTSVSVSSQPKPSPPGPEPKNKPQRKRHISRDGRMSDGFRSLSPTPATLTRIPVARTLPKLIDSPFGKSLTDKRGRRRSSGVISDASDTDSDDEGNENRQVSRERDAVEISSSWPPVRGTQRKASIGDTQRSNAVATTSNIRNKERGTPTPRSRDLPSSAHSTPSHLSFDSGHHPFSQPSQDLPLQSAQIEERTRERHHPFSQIRSVQARTSSRSVSPSLFLQARQEARRRIQQFIDEAEGRETSKDANMSDLHMELFGETIASIKHEDMHETSIRSPPESHVPRTDKKAPVIEPFRIPAQPTIVRHNSDSKKGRNGPFPAVDIFGRRQTFGGYTTSTPIPEIDLAAQANRSLRSNRVRRSLPTQIASTPYTNITSFTSVPPSVSNESIISASALDDAEREQMTAYGFDMMIKRIAKAHGFDENVVRLTFDRIGSLEKTDVAMKYVKEHAADAAEDIVPRLAEEVERSRVLGGSDIMEPLSRRLRRRSGPSPLKTSFVFSPADADEVSEYSPPETSRAARYKRMSLAQQSFRDQADENEFSANDPGESSEEEEPKALISESEDDAETSSAIVEAMTSAERVWGEDEDRILISGDKAALAALTRRMGESSIRNRAIQLLKSWKR